MNEISILLNAQSDSKYDTILQSGNIHLVANYSLPSHKDGQGNTYFLHGEVLGIKQKNGEITPTDGLSTLFENYSFDEINQLAEGRFIAIKTSASNEMEIILDRFAKFDLYFEKVGNGTILSTTQKDLPSFSTENFDVAQVAHSLMIYGNRPAKKQTLFNNISRLGVGETIHFKNDSFNIEKREFEPRRIAKFTEDDLHRYGEYFLESLRLRGSETGNIVYLSSGWDSTSILAGLVHVFGPSKVKGVIGRMKYSKRSAVINQFELDRAHKFAEHFGIELEVVEFNYSEHAKQYVDELCPLFKEHSIANMTAFNWANLAKHIGKIRKNNESVFCGETSDACHNLGFCQFASIFHPTYEFREYADKMYSYLFGPKFYQLMKNKDTERDQVYQFLKQNYTSYKLEDISASADNLSEDLLKWFFLRSVRFPGFSLDNEPMLTDKGKNLYDKELQTYTKEVASRVDNQNLYSGYLHLYNSFHWQGSTVASLALTANHYGFEIQIPFWDSRLQDWLSEMPEEFGRGLDLNNTKYPIKWTLKNIIKDYPFELQDGPHSYLYDVEHSFSHSSELLYGSSLTPIFKEKFKTGNYKKFLSSEYFNVSYFEELVKDFLSGVEKDGKERGDLFSLAMFALIND
tara:strand:- start:38705 stop:40597 length:1893 start_codon:yes stop_codon:yes gene_type:complete